MRRGAEWQPLPKSNPPCQVLCGSARLTAKWTEETACDSDALQCNVSRMCVWCKSGVTGGGANRQSSEEALDNSLRKETEQSDPTIC